MAGGSRPCTVPALGETVLAQHDLIRALAGEIGAAAEVPPLALRLRELRAVLSEHFRVEEGTGGFFERLQSASPRMESRARRLQEEHRILLASVERLAAEAATLEQRCHAVLADARELSRRLGQHEADELAALRESISTDLGRGA